MKKILFSILLVGTLLVGVTNAETTTSKSWWDKGTTPTEILDSIAGQANVDYKIQDTALDGVSATQWDYASEYKIANTLDSLRKKIWPYLQRTFYIGLGMATVLLVYYGIMLMSGALTGEDIKKTLGKLKNVAIGVAILTGFALIVRIFLAIMSSVLS